MKILKNFDSYIKEDLEMMADPTTRPSTSPSTPVIEPGTKPERRDRPTPIRRDRPAVEPDPQARIMDVTEEDGTYIGTQMLKDLADALGTDVMDNAVQYEGKTINFYSETEKFHVDKKKFATVEEVVNYLNGGNSSIKKETEEEEVMEGEEEVEDIEDEFKGEEIVRGRHIKEFENFMYDKDVEDGDGWDEYPEDWKVSQTLISSETDDEIRRELEGENEPVIFDEEDEETWIGNNMDEENPHHPCATCTFENEDDAEPLRELWNPFKNSAKMPKEDKDYILKLLNKCPEPDGRVGPGKKNYHEVAETYLNHVVPDFGNNRKAIQNDIINLIANLVSMANFDKAYNEVMKIKKHDLSTILKRKK